jgi:hypothetical protein
MLLGTLSMQREIEVDVAGDDRDTEGIEVDVKEFDAKDVEFGACGFVFPCFCGFA